MSRRFFSGTTVEQAVMKAARHFGIEPDELAYHRREKKHGFLKIRRSVVIEVDPEALTREDAPATPPRAPSAPPAISTRAPLASEESRKELDEAEEAAGAADFGDSEFGEGDEEYRDEAYGDEDFGDEDFGDEDEHDDDRHDGAPQRRDDEEEDDEGEDDEEEDDEAEDDEEDDDAPEIDNVFDAIDAALLQLAELADLEVDWEVEEREDGFWVDLSGTDSDLLTDEEGRLLKAIEHLVPRLVRGWIGHGVACKVDCDGFIEDHEESLRRLALDAAREARDEGETQWLDPMNPGDRRIIHMTLADEEGVETESDGNGLFKQVKVIPVD